MPDHDDTTPQESEYDGPSKSAVKRQMTALQQLGETLTHLTDKQLTQIPIEDERLRQVIAEARNIRSHSARKRHLQLIGKLMRHIDPQPIQQALEKLDQNRRQDAEQFHALEQMRDQILAAGVSGTELAAQRWPQADRQQLRQLVLQHQRELQKSKPLAASRKLFRYLRELQELYGADD
jgi:ribosome-associated protein